jgi:hypothetical protein
MPVLVFANEATAALRRVYFHLVDATDGITAETGEGAGQPEVSSDGAAFTSTGIGTLTHIGSGRYYADLTQALVATAGTAIETRYKSANTAESPGDSVRVVAFDPYDVVRMGLTALPNAAADAAGGLPISDAGGLDLDTTDSNVAAILSDTGTDGVVLAATATSAQLVDDVWDEVLTGATHNVSNSSGRRLRQVESGIVLHSGTAQAATSNTITLDAGASAIDDFYNHAKVVIEENTGVEQERIIVDYVGSTKVATIAPPWITTPDATSIFVVEPPLAHAETNSKTVTVGLAQAGAAGTITLATTASATNDFYNNDVVMIDAGTGKGQERIITDYDGTTKVATIEPNWITTPDTTSEYIVEESLCVADIFAISGDQTSADNLELDYDGTGYAKANSTVGTVTALTGHTAQTGDNYARIGAPVGASISADIAVVDGNVDTLITNVPDVISLAAINAECDTAVNDGWITTTVAEAYALDGSAGTPAELMYMIWSALSEFAIVTTTVTAKKLDGTTPAMTFTLDDATNPTSRTRAT